MTFGELVKKSRETKGWSQAELAAKSDVSPAFICMVEAGTKTPRIARATRILRAMGADVGLLSKVTETYSVHGNARANQIKARRKRAKA